MKATPITARVAENGVGWSVGRSTTRPKLDVTAGVDGQAEQRLMDQIQPRRSAESAFPGLQPRSTGSLRESVSEVGRISWA